MKVRDGFISNSSSSSFICEICNYTESGMDCGPEDFGMVRLQCDHLICEEHIEKISEEDFKKYALEDVQEELLTAKDYDITRLKKLYNDLSNSKSFKEFKEIYYNYFYSKYVKAQCPICNFEIIRDKDILNYFISNSSFTKEEIICKVRESLKNNNLKLEV